MNEFQLDYNVTGAERKRLVQAIAAHTGEDAKYLGAPSFSYRVGRYTIDRNGKVSFNLAYVDGYMLKSLTEALSGQGFAAQDTDYNTEGDETEHVAAEVDGLTIQMPADSFTSDALNNLHTIIAAKGRLIRKALGVDLLPIQVEGDKVSFPWFSGEATAEEVKAYTHLVTALCGMARTQKRITAKERDTDNEKYAFRCFLLRLGFIGPEYKEERKILLRNLSGSSAFKNGAPKEENTDAVSE